MLLFVLLVRQLALRPARGEAEAAVPRLGARLGAAHPLELLPHLVADRSFSMAFVRAGSRNRCRRIHREAIDVTRCEAAAEAREPVIVRIGARLVNNRRRVVDRVCARAWRVLPLRAELDAAGGSEGAARHIVALQDGAHGRLVARAEILHLVRGGTRRMVVAAEYLELERALALRAEACGARLGGSLEGLLRLGGELVDVGLVRARVARLGVERRGRRRLVPIGLRAERSRARQVTMRRLRPPRLIGARTRHEEFGGAMLETQRIRMSTFGRRESLDRLPREARWSCSDHERRPPCVIGRGLRSGCVVLIGAARW